MANKSTSAHATKKKPTKGKIKGMHVRLTNNGAVSQLMHEPPEDSMYAGEMPGEETVHSSMPHLVRHIKSNLGEHFAANTGSGGATQPASTPSSGGSAGNNDAGADEDEE